MPREGVVPETGVLARIKSSHATWVALLRSHGVTVDVFSHGPDAPDATFPNNWFSTHRTPDGRGLLTLFPMKHASRRRERRPDVIAHLQRGYADGLLDLTHWEAQDKFFEGTGSAVVDWLSGTVFVSLSQRSHADVVAEWVAWLSKQYGRAFRAVLFRSHHAGAEVYHTNVVMSVGTRHAVCCFDVMDDTAAVRAALAHKDVLVDITAAQLEAFCGNIIELCTRDGQRLLIMSSRAHAAFGADALQRLEGVGLRIVHSDLALLEHYGGGGIRCCIAELF